MRRPRLRAADDCCTRRMPGFAVQNTWILKSISRTQLRGQEFRAPPAVASLNQDESSTPWVNESTPFLLQSEVLRRDLGPMFVASIPACTMKMDESTMTRPSGPTPGGQRHLALWVGSPNRTAATSSALRLPQGAKSRPWPPGGLALKGPVTSNWKVDERKRIEGLP